MDALGVVLVLRRGPFPLDVVELGAAEWQVERFDTDRGQFLAAASERSGHVCRGIVEDDGAGAGANPTCGRFLESRRADGPGRRSRAIEGGAAWARGISQGFESAVLEAVDRTPRGYVVTFEWISNLGHRYSSCNQPDALQTQPGKGREITRPQTLTYPTY